ncbi:hypothetical protein B0H14DRAFT_2769297 [Mycena olivaceomarginata]|nr:hypothetical protein B0H14DRAFT_2769297 [Mycena olivaceomarginata]
MVKGSDVLLIFVAILLPPGAVAATLLINILLTILGYIPGHIHAFWLIYKKMKAEERYGAGGFRYTGNGTYEPIAAGGQPQAYYGATN